MHLFITKSMDSGIQLHSQLLSCKSNWTSQQPFFILSPSCAVSYSCSWFYPKFREKELVTKKWQEKFHCLWKTQVMEMLEVSKANIIPRFTNNTWNKNISKLSPVSEIILFKNGYYIVGRSKILLLSQTSVFLKSILLQFHNAYFWKKGLQVKFHI